jgi:hypothetical protein
MEMNDDATCYATCKGMITLKTVVKSWFVTAENFHFLLSNRPTSPPPVTLLPEAKKRGCGYHTS